MNSLTIVYSTVYSGADQRKHQSSASLAFVRGIHRWPVNSRHKRPVTRKMFLLDDVIMIHKNGPWLSWYHRFFRMCFPTNYRPSINSPGWSTMAWKWQTHISVSSIWTVFVGWTLIHGWLTNRELWPGLSRWWQRTIYTGWCHCHRM